MPTTDAEEICMQPTSGTTVSVWAATAATPNEKPLSEDTTTNVCIIGAGIAGLTTAYLLARAGKAVVVVDDGPIGGGMTARTTAHLTNALDDRFFELERLFGEDGARLAGQSHTAAIDRVEEIVREETIDCEFERLDGYLFLPTNGRMKVLEDELPAAHRAGLTTVRRLDRAPLDSFDTGPCLHFPRQAQFHPLKYLSGLTAAIERDGGQIFTGTHADQIEGGEHAYVTSTGGYKISCDAIVVATNTPVNDRMVIHTKQAPYTTYVIGARIPRGSVPTMLLWDAPADLWDAYHYIRTEHGDDYDVLIVGGEDHKTGQQHDGAQRWGKLEQWTRNRFPMAEEIEYRWSGQVMEPVDGLAFIGRNPADADNVFIATGDSGMGMTHGTIAGMLLSDLIMGRENPWTDLYDPSRKTLSAVKDFVEENINVAAQYADAVTPGEIDSTEQIAKGEGGVIRKGLSKVAVYRDDDGTVHSMSAVCVHLGCIVTWNSAEKTWDCPCHGSRYDAVGTVINGPANSDLPPEEI
ncbi:MAG TPA: FAD-dependent oxidoreductase [Pyrinomonadaceae bacterium]|nr:FAD-dependent oxidoreductase [Pyrinomonadaceae bacterium]